ncbi:HAMP domain-containing histidine kinase [Streptomyces sp. So13.3]|uniref:HAMP domain-containing sensor histidine kinase n=1 Tax=Streptomyces TaxID=1883 RepID=UPI0011069843|nr:MULTISPECIES: HAMP domain-containing sensor histidine kinase [unclassified Streptomyces]MCZ4102197.1 HAMP domain-containing sensor histidine kinase [Streptomyces sp. H39-C1]QNA70619.1 HAMP domain-containing histidine kinase [Streptomyces sp. So13.3]
MSSVDGHVILGRGFVGSSVRGRVMVSIVAVTACAVLVFTVPLAIAVDRIYRDGAVACLERDAIWAAASLSGGTGGAPDRLVTLHPPSHGVHVGVYSPLGRRVHGSGPALSPGAASSRDGSLHRGVEGGNLAVFAPVVQGGTVREVVRAWMPWDPVADSTMLAWLLLAAVGAVVVALAALLAWRVAGRVATPLERLTASAQALGSGDFSIRPECTGIREADAAWQALATTAGRLGALLERERRFSTAVSHQLRTPLTALVLGLDTAQSLDDQGRGRALVTALRRAEHLGDTIEDLLRLARETHHQADIVEVEGLLNDIARRHRDAIGEAGRRLTVRCEAGLPPVSASAAAVAQIMGTLMDNALVHGRGEVRLSATDVGAGVALEVGDDGPGPAGDGDAVFGTVRRDGQRHGIGMPLARSLAEAEGGRLLLRRPGPRPVFSLLLPACEPLPATDAGSCESLPGRSTVN